MRWNLLARWVLAAGPALFSGRAATPATSVFINSTAKSDVAAKPGQAGTQADAVASQMEVSAAIALSDRYPCASAMRPSDVSAILGWERLKALLGNDPSPDVIEKIGGAIGAGYMLNFQVTQAGGQTTITGLGMNTGTGKVFARNTVTLPNGSGMATAMQAFANSFVGSLGAGGPKCPGGLKGTITVSSVVSGTAKGGSSSSNLSIQCNVMRSAQCDVSYSGQFADKDMSGNERAKGHVETTVEITRYQGQATIQLGMIRLKGTHSVSSVLGSLNEPYDFTFGGWTVPAGSSQGNSFSGSYSANDITIAWNLSM